MQEEKLDTVEATEREETRALVREIMGKCVRLAEDVARHPERWNPTLLFIYVWLALVLCVFTVVFIESFGQCMTWLLAKLIDALVPGAGAIGRERQANTTADGVFGNLAFNVVLGAWLFMLLAYAGAYAYRRLSQQGTREQVAIVE